MRATTVPLSVKAERRPVEPAPGRDTWVPPLLAELTHRAERLAAADPGALTEARRALTADPHEPAATLIDCFGPPPTAR